MLRQVVFWTHLVAGLVTGLVVFILCLTGAILAFELQIVDYAEREPRAHPATPGAELLPPAALISRAAEFDHDRAGSVEYFADPAMPVRINTAGRHCILLDGTTGTPLSHGAVRLRAFMRWITEVHTTLTAPPSGTSIIGIANACFLFLILSGLWLWCPRQWRWKIVRNSVRLRLDVRGKARDWNWHNALGFWFLLPLLFIAASGLVLSFRPVDQWWRSFGGRHYFSAPQPPIKIPFVPPDPSAPAADWPQWMHLVQQQTPGWRSIVLNGTGKPNAEGILTFTVHRGTPRQRARSASVTLDTRTGRIVEEKTWTSDDGSTRARAIARLGHTGEILGTWGQTLGLAACLAGCVLVYTGFALSWRRFFFRRGTADAPTPTLISL